MIRSSGAKRKGTFLSPGEGSRRRQKLTDGSIGGRGGKKQIAEDCAGGSGSEEEVGGNLGAEVLRRLDDVTGAGRSKGARCYKKRTTRKLLIMEGRAGPREQ
ncbi:hypothetical protein XENTR_v10017664 [Xenopus tropicalis]|nr:hypothetical protein XENTR_v10017664 [Xenopus tropicalis]